MWLLAADHDGVIPASPQKIQKLCFMSKPPDINKFTDLGFIENGWRQDGVTLASNGCQHDRPKADTEADTDKNREVINTSSEQTILSIPLIKRDGQFSITQSLIDEWADSFPRVDIPLALKRIRQWNIDNPKKRKTKGGIRDHIATWLAKAQDKGEFRKEEKEDSLTDAERAFLAKD